MTVSTSLTIGVAGILVTAALAADGASARSRAPAPTPTAPAPGQHGADERGPRRSPRAGETFSDCAGCPRMVVIPGGSFTMGSPEDEPGRRQFEGPQRVLGVASFAMGETEVTRGQFAAFVRETSRTVAAGCHTHGDGTDLAAHLVPSASWRDPGFEQTSEHPVVCVSWHDARDYVAWLSRKTGQTYRLPSEAEWEYAARAGTTTPFFWGESADRECAHMNGGDLSLVRAVPVWRKATDEAFRAGEVRARLVECDDGSAFTAPVGRYEPNPFGLRDVTGNVWEWVEDCWSESLPVDGRPRATPEDCDHRTRGGSWNDWPADLRSARRSRLPPDARWSAVGFRVARTISPSAAPRSRSGRARPGTSRSKRLP